MPFTPFHFGPGLLTKALLPQRFSMTIFIATQIIIDLEAFYFIATGAYPTHRFLHTYVGATLVAAGVVLALRLWTPKRYSLSCLLVSTAVGVYSHVALDSLMHPDQMPFQPFSAANPALGAVSVEALHVFCVLTGVMGALILALWRRRR